MVKVCRYLFDAIPALDRRTDRNGKTISRSACYTCRGASKTKLEDGRCWNTVYCNVTNGILVGRTTNLNVLYRAYAPTAVTKFKAGTLNMGWGRRKIAIFDRNYRLSRKEYEKG